MNGFFLRLSLGKGLKLFKGMEFFFLQVNFSFLKKTLFS